MTIAEAVMCGGLGGMVIGGVVATIIVRSGMIPETCVIMLQDRLWRALSAVRLATARRMAQRNSKRWRR